MTESEMIDEVLLSVQSGGNLRSFDKDDFLLYGPAIRKMQAYSLIETRSGSNFLTQQGYQVIQAGGFEKWKAAVEQKEAEAHQAVLDTAKATVEAADSAKSSARAAWVGGAVAVLSFAYSAYTGQQADELKGELKKVNERVEALDSLVTPQRRSQTTSVPSGYRVSSDSSVRPTVPASGSPATGGRK